MDHGAEQIACGIETCSRELRKTCQYLKIIIVVVLLFGSIYLASGPCHLVKLQNMKGNLANSKATMQGNEFVNRYYWS
jgi:hypothetical protein